MHPKIVKFDYMKVRTYVLAIPVALTLMASGNKQAKPTVGLNPGDLAPRIESLEKGCSVRFQNQEGRYTLLNFWAVYDAESRMRNVRLSNVASQCDTQKVMVCSISLDEMKSVFEETVKTDQLEGTIQWQEAAGKASPVYKQYELKPGFRNFLIDDKGVIVAANLTPEQLAARLKAI